MNANGALRTIPVRLLAAVVLAAGVQFGIALLRFGIAVYEEPLNAQYFRAVVLCDWDVWLLSSASVLTCQALIEWSRPRLRMRRLFSALAVPLVFLIVLFLVTALENYRAHGIWGERDQLLGHILLASVGVAMVVPNWLLTKSDGGNEP